MDSAAFHPELEEYRLNPLFWTRRTSLTARILVVNILALAMLAGSLVYLDSYRKQLLAERFAFARSEAQIMAEALHGTSIPRRDALMAQLGMEQRMRIRLYDPSGALVADSFALAPAPSFRLIDPATEPWYQDAARLIDRGMDFILGTKPVAPYEEPVSDNMAAWPEARLAAQRMQTTVVQRYAPDRTPVINAAAPTGLDGAILLTTRNAIDITHNVREARQTLAIIIAMALLVSIQLSLFLARTIVRPLRALARAAVRVRLGRDREVVVPRLPERRDEIGLLARAISDMTAALRSRIDEVEHFAADVAHEIKNPLASLRSALESLGHVEDRALRHQLAAIAVHDLQRIDRLITEIADASRIEAELSRATYEIVDLSRLISNAIGARTSRQETDSPRIILNNRTGHAAFLVMGVPARLERIIENLLDNAASFSAPEDTITVDLEGKDTSMIMRICDEGPGIPEAEREKVFERFHSVRPEGEGFGNHSGLGLAIARTIAQAHDGTLRAISRPDGKTGACLELKLPAAR